jgi:hypothetical protein
MTYSNENGAGPLKKNNRIKSYLATHLSSFFIVIKNETKGELSRLNRQSGKEVVKT